MGRRITATVSTGTSADGGTVDVVDEVWESPELPIVIASRTNDPRSGVLDFRVTKIRRTEPSARLFEVPADYVDRPQTQDEAYEFRYEPTIANRPLRRPGGR